MMGVGEEEVMTGRTEERGVNDKGARKECDRRRFVLHCDQVKSILCWEQSVESLKKLWQIDLTVFERSSTFSVK